MAASTTTKHLYGFDAFRLDAEGRTLSRDGRPLPLAPKIFDTLLVLVEHSGQVMEKDELLRLVWPDSVVEENNLSQNIFHLRKLLGENGNGQQYIETITRRGYRFTARVKDLCCQEPPANGLHHSNGHLNGNAAGSISGGNDPGSLFPVAASQPRIEAAPVRRMLPLALAGVAILTAMVYLASLARQIFPARPLPTGFPNLSISKLTNNVNVRCPVFSADGKYIAYAVEERGRQSLHLRQTLAGNDVQIAAPEKIRYLGLAFSPDGNFLYYAAAESEGGYSALYRIPLLGGLPQPLVNDVDSPISFSPDGAQLAFVRNTLSPPEVAVMLVNADGRGERKVAVRQKPSYYSNEGPAWSADGRMIVCAAGNFDASNPYMTLVGIDPKTGQETVLTNRKLSYLGQVAGMDDGSGVVAIVGDTAAPLFSNQLWFFPKAGGEPWPITNDPNAYRGVSVAQPLGLMLTVKTNKVAHIQILSLAQTSQIKQLTFGSGDESGERLGMTWTPDGRILYASQQGANTDLWVMDADGGNRRQLTADAGIDYLPAIGPDGRYIFFTSNRAGQQSNIWRMDSNGENARRLTTGRDDENPAVTPDGRWVIYTTRNDRQWTMWKVAIEGGAPIQLTQDPAQKPAISPNGQLIACYYYDTEQARYRLAIIPIDGGRPIRLFDAAVFNFLPIYWTPDAGALTYADTRDGVTNLWQQPINGGAPHQLTNFNSDRIFRYALSGNGRTLVCERGTVANDLVLIKYPKSLQ